MTTRAKGATRFATAKKLGEGTWKLNACPMDGGRLVALGGGKFGAVWLRAGEVFLTREDGAETILGKGRQPVAVLDGAEPLIVWQQGNDLVSMRGFKAGETLKHASEARFPTVVPLQNGKGALLAYERGAKGATSVVVERLRIGPPRNPKGIVPRQMVFLAPSRWIRSGRVMRLARVAFRLLAGIVFVGAASVSPYARRSCFVAVAFCHLATAQSGAATHGRFSSATRTTSAVGNFLGKRLAPASFTFLAPKFGTVELPKKSAKRAK